MTQQNTLELAKQGNIQAITSLMNHSLGKKGITAKVALKDTCLHIMLESNQAPNQQELVTFVRKGITNLGVSSIERAKIYGKQIGEEFPAWNVDLEIIGKNKNSTENYSHNVDTNSNVSHNQNKYYEIEGSNGQIRLTPNRIIISRKGTIAFISQGLKGDKEIPINRITAMQFKASDNFTKGYLQFSIQGGIESTGGVFAATTDENTVMFTELEQPEFEEVKRYVNSVIDEEPIDFGKLNFLELKQIKTKIIKEQNTIRRNNVEDTKKIALKLIKPLIIVAVVSYIITYFSPDDSAIKILSAFVCLISTGCTIIAGIRIVDNRI